MFETLMNEVIDMKPPAPEKVDFLDLGLAGQSESKNMEDLLSKCQAEIRTLLKTQQETARVTIDTNMKLERAQEQIKYQGMNIEVDIG